MNRRVFALALASLPFARPARADGQRTILVPVVLGGGPRAVYSEHGEPNGMPCGWYDYAPTVGLDYCDHPGIDVEADFEVLHAATDGVVEFSGADGYYSPLHVCLRVGKGVFEGELHIYGHMSEVWVAPGQEVERGDPIGVSGTAGSGPHLHFERRSEPSEAFPVGEALDPGIVLRRK